jgi:uncharacterized membrane protein YdcZ (DUF606 family)
MMFSREKQEEIANKISGEMAWWILVAGLFAFIYIFTGWYPWK